MVDDPFSGWGLRPVELADRAVLDPYLASLSHPLSDYTFSQLYTWRNSLRIAWAQLEGHLCVFANGTGDLTLLVPPIGDTGSDRALTDAFELMDDYNAAHGVPNRSRVEYVSDELLARFDRDRLQVEALCFDYVYDVGRMIDLAGGDLASKRQAKNRFTRLYEHRVEPYSAARHMEECRRLLQQWKLYQDAGDEPTAISHAKRQKESTATELTLEVAEELGLRGMVVYVKGEDGSFGIRGFTFGEPLGRDQSSIVVEKTDLGVKGLAQFIFSEFCRTYWSDRPLVNAGDDWGVESLAWTKMSYRPVRLLQKYVLRQCAAVSSATAAPTTDAPSTQPGPAASASAEVSQMPVRVRLADKKDVYAALELERACFSPDVRLKKRQLQYLQQRRSAVFFVAQQGDAVVGEGIALVRQHKRGVSGRVYSLAVNQQCRGQRIGQKLLRAMLDALASRGVRRVYLEVEDGNAAALRLYSAHGFRRIGVLPNYYGQSRDGVHMMAEIAATTLTATSITESKA